MNKFAAANLTKRANAKADAIGLTGEDRDLFCFVAVNSAVSFRSLMGRFGVEVAFGMKRLMDAGYLFQQYSADLYYTLAI